MGYLLFDKNIGRRNLFGRDTESATGTERGWSPLAFTVGRAGLWVPTSVGGIQTISIFNNAGSLETAPGDTVGVPLTSNGVDQAANGSIEASLGASDETGGTAIAFNNTGGNAAIEISASDPSASIYGSGTSGNGAPQATTYYQLNGGQITSSEYAASIPWPLKGTFGNFYVFAPGLEDQVGSEDFTFEMRVNAQTVISINANGGDGPFLPAIGTGSVNVGDYVAFIVRRNVGTYQLTNGIDLYVSFVPDVSQPSEPSTLSKGVLLWTSSPGHDDTSGGFAWPSGTTYSPLGGIGLPNATSTMYRVPAPRAMRFTNVIVRLQGAAGAVTITGGFSVNGLTHPGLSISIPATGTVHTFPCDVQIQEGDEVNWRWTASAATVRPRYVTVAYEVMR